MVVAKKDKMVPNSVVYNSQRVEATQMENPHAVCL